MQKLGDQFEALPFPETRKVKTRNLLKNSLQPIYPFLLAANQNLFFLDSVVLSKSSFRLIGKIELVWGRSIWLDQVIGIDQFNIKLKG